jgi:predicted glutamine amidotransferase
MCIAIFNKQNLLSFDIIKNSWENNNDGAGLLWIENGALQVFKEANSMKLFYKKYKAIRANNALPILLHFRIGTHGNFADYNLHPFLVNNQIGFVHNGVIRITEIDARYSDTNHFNRLVLQTMKTPARIFKDGTNEAALVSHFCSTNSKLIFLNAAGQHRIFNESAGHWDKFGNWFSNRTYEACTYRDFGGKKVSKASQPAGRAYGGYYGGSYYNDWLYDGKDASAKPASKPAVKSAGNVPPAIAKITGVKYPPVERPAIIPASTPAKTYAPDFRAECLALLGYGPDDLGAESALTEAMKEHRAYSYGDLYAAMLYK